MKKIFALLCFLLGCICLAQEDNDTQKMREELKNLKERVQSLEKMLTESKQKNAEPKPEATKEEKNYVDAYWKGRPVFETRDKMFSFSVSSFAALDVGFVHEDQAVKDQLDEIEDFAKFRFARIGVAGTFYRDFYYRLQFEFAGNNEVAFRDALIGMQGLPLDGSIQIGFMKEPFGLEELTSRMDTTFLERASNSGFNPNRQLGLQYKGNFDKRATFTIGVFREVEDDDPPRVENDSGNYVLTSRFTALPIYTEEEDLMHLGIAYSFRNPLNDTVIFDSRPEIAIGPQFVEAILEDVSYAQLLGLEWAFVRGPFSIQTETIAGFVRLEENDSPIFWGSYVFAGYVLTGEKRLYNKEAGVFKRPESEKNFWTDEGGIGAIELAVRYSVIDLNEDAIRGRRMDDITVGVNWYLNQHLKIQVNYIYSLLKNLDDSERTDTNIATFRVFVTF